jgi:hypothetical protein
MNTLSTSYFVRAEMWLFITTLAYFLMNGAQLFETAVIVPKWTASPPESFQLFRGTSGLDFKAFWIVTHSIHELTFIFTSSPLFLRSFSAGRSTRFATGC